MPTVTQERRSVRFVAAACTLVLGSAVVLLSLSDAAPYHWRRLSNRLAYHLPFGPPAQLTSFTSPWGVHFVAWAVLTFVAVHMVRRWTARLGVALAVLAFGVLVELAQDRLSTLRSSQAVDLGADLRGVLVGLAAAGAVHVVRLRSTRSTTARR